MFSNFLFNECLHPYDAYSHHFLGSVGLKKCADTARKMSFYGRYLKKKDLLVDSPDPAEPRRAAAFLLSAGAASA